MAFPQVPEAPLTGSSSGTNVNVPLHASYNPGDLILIFVNRGTNPPIEPSGFDTIASRTESGDFAMRCFAKIANGSEGGDTVSINGTSSVTLNWQVYRITNWAESLSSIFVSTVAFGTSTTPNPAALDPGLGALDFLWIVFAGTGSTTDFSNDPTNYSGFLSLDSNPTMATSRRELNASSENPGVFTIGASTLWAAFTLAIAPATVIELSAEMLGFSGFNANLTAPKAPPPIVAATTLVLYP